jgi:hypothetical protein
MLVIILSVLVGVVLLLSALKLLGLIAIGWSTLAMIVWLPLAVVGVVLAPIGLFTGSVLLVRKIQEWRSSR